MLWKQSKSLNRRMRQLKELLKRTYENTHKPKQCDYCKHYRHHGKRGMEAFTGIIRDMHGQPAGMGKIEPTAGGYLPLL